ncbi:hypothetical protein GQ55_3G116000 [Panicum hallii var. hallii]|uniref:Uncharacterized protein n=1 Tax=Panicum hallii var. hallii TaxID=1504633 RepID=A0A2T7E8D4_9POAL|nr:hypothetical protein GQ55_3G116000 [Panicum hallii var. hallii]
MNGGSSSAAAGAMTKRPEPDRRDGGGEQEAARGGGGVVAEEAVRVWRARNGRDDGEALQVQLYWEDPAHAARVQYYGLNLAREAALDNFIESLRREFEAYMAGQPFKP